MAPRGRPALPERQTGRRPRLHARPGATGSYLPFTETTPDRRPPDGRRDDSRAPDPRREDTVSEIVLTVLADALGAALLALVTVAIRRVVAAVRA